MIAVTERVRVAKAFIGKDRRVNVTRENGKSFTVQNAFSLSGGKDNKAIIERRDQIDDWYLLSVQKED